MDPKPGNSSTDRSGWQAGRQAVRQETLARIGMIGLAIAAQITTVIITWPLWNFRAADATNPSLPVFELPHLPFAWAMIFSALLPMIWRRTGVWVHLAVLLVASCADQFRLQPQFFFNWLLMWAAVSEPAGRILRWALSTMWLWAGVHKLFSPDWLGYRSSNFFEKSGFGLEEFHVWLAVLVAVVEIAVGLAAWRKPKLAAVGCVLLHVGIILLLVINRQNYSVIPWNIATAVIGAWVLWTLPAWQKISRKESLIATLLFTTPALFYVGALDHGFSNVLYSGMIPQGLITLTVHDDKVETDSIAPTSKTVLIDGWNELAVPFPKERRLLWQHFEIVAPIGSKLHIAERRPWLDDLFLIQTAEGAVAISRQDFFNPTDGSIVGIGHQCPQANFLFEQANIRRLVRRIDQPIYAIAFEPKNFDRRWLNYLEGFPNLEQIQFAGCDLRDDDLVSLKSLMRLQGLGLSNTNVTDAGLRHLSHLPMLRHIEKEGTSISDDAITSR